MDKILLLATLLLLAGKRATLNLNVSQLLLTVRGYLSKSLINNDNPILNQ